MNTKLAGGSVAWGGLVATLVASGCAADKVSSPPREAGIAESGGSAAIGSGGSTGEGGATGTTTDGSSEVVSAVSRCRTVTGQEQIDCGEYIVRHLDACGDCHSPTDRTTGGPSQNPDLFLTGNPSFADLDPTDDQVGNVPAPNLTVLGRDGWTAKDLKSAILDGVRPAARGGGLLPIMPYATLHNMAREDADAIVAYLQSLPVKGHQMAERDPLPVALSTVTLPIPPFAAEKIPDPGVSQYPEDALFGKYLAAELGLCMECHTPRDATMQLDASRLFAGGETFALLPPFGTVTSANITPAANGIGTWTAEDVKNLILTGLDSKGAAICPPMPVGPNGAFGGMNPNEALAIGRYLTNIPGIVNPPAGGTPFGECVPPTPLPVDSGTKPNPPDAAITPAADAG